MSEKQTILVIVPVDTEIVQCVECGTAHASEGLTAPCEHIKTNGGQCGGTTFIPLHQVSFPEKQKPAPLKYRYQRVLKARGYDPYHAEHELLYFIRSELNSNAPCIGYIEEKAAALINHVKKGLVDNDNT